MLTPRLHLVTDDAVLSDRDLLARVEAVAEVVARFGLRVALHLRGPGLTSRQLWEVGRSVTGALFCRAAEGNRILLLVNDRVDLACALGADGVHLPYRGLPAGVARRLLPGGALVGCSVHGVEEVGAVIGGWFGKGGDAQGSAEGPPSSTAPDYVVVGNLWPTGSHPGRPGGGPDRLDQVRRFLVGEGASLPLIGIGGITPERVGEVLAVGAHGIAVRSGVWDAEDPGRAVARYLSALSQISA